MDEDGYMIQNVSREEKKKLDMLRIMWIPQVLFGMELGIIIFDHNQFQAAMRALERA